MTPADIRARRDALGMTQRAMAEALGVPLNTYARWEQGARQPENPSLLRLALDHLALERTA